MFSKIYQISSISRIIAIFACIPMIAYADDQNLKTGVVNMEKLVGEYYKTKAFAKKVDEEKKLVIAGLEEKHKLLVDLKSQLTALDNESKSDTLGDDRRKKLIEEQQAKYQQFTQYDAYLGALIARKQRAFTEKHKTELEAISKEVRNIVEQFAKEQEYEFVFDKSAYGRVTTLIVFSKDAEDVTSLIIEKIKRDEPAEALKDDAEPEGDK